MRAGKGAVLSRAMFKWLLIAALVGYAGLVALLYVTQRALQYFPERFRTAPAAAGLPQAEEVVLDTADGERVIAWHLPPRGEKPVILYFHGNGASLRRRCRRDALLVRAGAAPHEGPVPLGLARRQDHRAGAGDPR